MPLILPGDALALIGDPDFQEQAAVLGFHRNAGAGRTVLDCVFHDIGQGLMLPFAVQQPAHTRFCLLRKHDSLYLGKH